MPKIRKWLKKRRYQPSFAVKNVAASAQPIMARGQFDAIYTTSHMVPYDENLLERSRTQWQFGDRASLAALDQTTLQHHPDRAKLTLLAAAGPIFGQTRAGHARHHRGARGRGCWHRKTGGHPYEYFGLLFMFYSNAHEPVHVHAKSQGREGRAVIIVINGTVTEITYSNVAGRYPLDSNELKFFEEVVSARANDIVAKWVDFFVMHKPIKSETITRRLK